MDQQNEKHYRTPFYLACRNEDIELVKSMLEDTSIDVNWATKGSERTAFMCACSKQRPNIELIRVLMNTNRIDYNKTDCNDGMTGFCMLFSNPDDEIMKYKISEHKMNIIKELMNDSRIDITQDCFERACYNGTIELIDLFLNNSRIDPNVCDSMGQTIFFRLCRDNCNIKTVKYLLDNSNIDVNLANTSGITPFINAFTYDADEIIKLLASNDRIKINHSEAIIRVFGGTNDFEFFKKLIKTCDPEFIERF